MDAVSYSLASKQAQRIEKFIENPDSTSGIVTVPKTIASGETVTVPAGRVAVLPNVQVDGTLNIEGEVFIPSGSSVDFTNGIKVNGNNISLSIPTSYNLLSGNLTTTITANYKESSSTTTRNYTTSDYIFDTTNYKLYDCILSSTSGVLLTNTTYFTPIVAGTLSINNGIIPLAHGIDSNGSKNSIVVKNETITGVAYTEGKNYLYKTDTGYGVKPYKPRYLASELVRTFAGEQPDYYDVESNKWFNCDVGTELVTNGTFDSNTTGWTADGSNILSVSNGTILVNRNNSTANGAKQTIATTIGKKYTIRLKVTSLANSGTPLVFIGSTVNGAELGTYLSTTTGTFEYSFIAQSTSTYLQFGVTTSATGIVGYDDISVFAYDITPTTEITESRNYMNHIVHADADGGVLYVEELPKVEYKNVIKAEKYLGSQIIIGRARINLATTPPTIIDYDKNINGVINGVVRTATGVCEIYIDNQDNNSYSVMCSTVGGASAGADTFTNSKFKVYTVAISPYALSNIEFTVTIFRGKN